MDKREEILNVEHTKYVVAKGVSAIYPKDFPAAYKEPAINAMDEYMRETCLELLEYMANNLVICGHYSSADGLLFKVKGHELLTKEQLFENFL